MDDINDDGGDDEIGIRENVCIKYLFTCPIELPISECVKELLLVSPGAVGSDPWSEWCFKTDDAVLLSSSSSSSDADPNNESANNLKRK